MIGLLVLLYHIVLTGNDIDKSTKELFQKIRDYYETPQSD